MSGLENGKFMVKPLEEVRCVILEKGVSKERVDFVKGILEFNGLTVKFQEDKKKKEEDPTTYSYGVTDVTFSPILAVYKRLLKTKDGRKITPAYYNQETKETHPNYWDKTKI